MFFSECLAGVRSAFRVLRHGPTVWSDGLVRHLRSQGLHLKELHPVLFQRLPGGFAGLLRHLPQSCRGFGAAQSLFRFGRKAGGQGLPWSTVHCGAVHQLIQMLRDLHKGHRTVTERLGYGMVMGWLMMVVDGCGMLEFVDGIRGDSSN